jgi:hypothetical protein
VADRKPFISGVAIPDINKKLSPALGIKLICGTAEQQVKDFDIERKTLLKS